MQPNISADSNSETVKSKTMPTVPSQKQITPWTCVLSVSGSSFPREKEAKKLQTVYFSAYKP